MIPREQLMEQIAMYLAALPCPPLPLIVSRDEEESYSSSHGLIGELLIGAMSSGDQALNAQRKVRQMELTDQLLVRLKAAQGDMERVYSAFSEFTAGYICAFMNIETAVSFMPLDRVHKGDCVHRACCGWHKAQEVILLRSRRRDATDQQIQGILSQDVSHMTYPELMGRHCMRFLAEEEERS